MEALRCKGACGSGSSLAARARSLRDGGPAIEGDLAQLRVPVEAGALQEDHASIGSWQLADIVRSGDCSGGAMI